MKKQAILKYLAVFNPAEEGGYNVSFPSFPGCVTFGKTFENAKKMAKEVLENDVFPAFKVAIPKLTKDSYSFDEFMEIVDSHPDIQGINVRKQRFGYLVNNTICEVGNVFINGAKVVTISSESTEVEDIKKTIAEVGLEGFENINYLQAIKRVIGWINKPLAN